MKLQFKPNFKRQIRSNVNASFQKSKTVRIIIITLLLIVQVIALILVAKLYEPTVTMMNESGLHRLASLFTMAPILSMFILLSGGITISLLIISLTRLKNLWWLLIIELASVAAHIYILMTLINVLKG